MFVLVSKCKETQESKTKKGLCVTGSIIYTIVSGKTKLLGSVFEVQKCYISAKPW